MTVRRMGYPKFLLAFLVFIVAPSVSLAQEGGACQNYSNFLGGPTSWIYKGQFGVTPVRMMLHYDDKTKQIVGEYGFSEVRSVQTVAGKITDEGRRLQLQERDANGRLIGNLELVFEPPDGMKNDDECTYLTGEEISESDHAHRGVSLFRGNFVAIRLNQARKLNEDAAFKIQQALKNNNIASFAKLVSYPLEVKNGVGDSVYGSSEAVIKNYQKIVTPTRAFVISAIPHELETSLWGTRFAGGVMCLSDGKVTQICDGGCVCP